jgi:hypothetical protein
MPSPLAATKRPERLVLLKVMAIRAKAPVPARLTTTSPANLKASTRPAATAAKNARVSTHLAEAGKVRRGFVRLRLAPLLRHGRHIPHYHWYHHIVLCVVYFPYNRSREYEIKYGKDKKDLSNSLILMHLWLWDV